MLRKIILLALISVSTFAIEVKGNNVVYQYDIDVDVQNGKHNGSSWDATGGAPDILLRVNGSTIPFTQNCKNTYRCTVSFFSGKKNLYLEVYDRDIFNHDLVGKGTISIGKTLHLGKAKINIHRKNKND